MTARVKVRRKDPPALAPKPGHPAASPAVTDRAKIKAIEHRQARRGEIRKARQALTSRVWPAKVQARGEIPTADPPRPAEPMEAPSGGTAEDANGQHDQARGSGDPKRARTCKRPVRLFALLRT